MRRLVGKTRRRTAVSSPHARDISIKHPDVLARGSRGSSVGQELESFRVAEPGPSRAEALTNFAGIVVYEIKEASR
jgi:hypothetical protein